MSRLDETIQAKIEKRQALQDRGVMVHPYGFDKLQSIAQLNQADEGASAQTAGRIMTKRPHGKVIFLDLQDSTASIQVMLRKGELSQEQFELFQFIDPGDFLGVIGKVMRTKTGELTILASEVKFLGKALRPLPSQWNVAEDKEVRFRQRYVDILINKEVRQVLDARWQVVKEIRHFLQDEHDFIEVETPILQPLYGGTNARPFFTYMKSLDTDLYLRIAPELYLKRLIVAGYERIFEIARNFRNEGIDQTHQPEFTMIEWYQAYADYQTMMNVAEEMIKKLAEKVNSSSEIMVGETKVDLAGKWPRIKMTDALKEYAGIDFDRLDDQAVQALLKKHDIELVGKFNRGVAMFNLFDKIVTKKLIQPSWIIDYPRDVSPLAKAHRDDPRFCERFEAYVGGKELADGWSEVVDPIDQRQLFVNEQQLMRAGDDLAHPTDEDFLQAMEYGMPPLGGIGIGIDRLVMFLTNTWSIKEVIAFPTLKPEQPIKITQLQRGEGKGGGEGGGEDEGAVGKDKESVGKEEKTRSQKKSSHKLPSRQKSRQLFEQYIKNENLRHHCLMTAQAMEAYAQKLDQDPELWFQTGLLHDLDWEMFPDEHPNKAVNELLLDYPAELIKAVQSHASLRTKVEPTTLLDRYLFACDELSGFLHAYSLMRPEGFVGMKANKVKKKLSDKSFASNVSRDDIAKGFELIKDEPLDHIQFLIQVFTE